MNGEVPAAPRTLLRRSKTEKVIAGVAGGLARYLDVDPILIRIVFVVLAVGGGSGILLYIIGWIAIPEEKEGDPLGPASEKGKSARLLIGGVIIVVGAVLLVNQIVPGLSRFFWPVVVIAVGAGILLGSRR